jgi:hypothetical protein
MKSFKIILLILFLLLLFPLIVFAEDAEPVTADLKLTGAVELACPGRGNYEVTLKEKFFSGDEQKMIAHFGFTETTFAERCPGYSIAKKEPQKNIFERFVEFLSSFVS